MLSIGSRGSALALWQANFIARSLESRGSPCKIEIIKTTGDYLQTASLVQAGGKGLFTKEIEEALLRSKIDVAVHSLKDLPTEMTPGLVIAAVPEREDPRDALVGCPLHHLQEHARVGTSSLRRAAQLRMLRPDLQIEPIRGNVDTRLRKLDQGQYAAIVLAAAGLHRLGLQSRIAQYFSPAEICPAPAQGALGIQTREQGTALQVCKALAHVETSICVAAERLVLAHLGGGCQLPIGAYGQVIDGALTLQAAVVAPDGSASLRATRTGPLHDYLDLARQVGQELSQGGAAALVA